MKKLLVVVLCVVSTLSLVSCSPEDIKNKFSKQEPEPEIVDTEPEEVYEPTLEEILGFTGEDLLGHGTTGKYQKVNYHTHIEYTVDVLNRTLKCSTDESVSHLCNENVGYDVITRIDNSGNNVSNYSTLVYTSRESSKKYFNNNYEGWYYIPNEVYDEYFDATMDRAYINVTQFEQQGDRLYVYGESNTSYSCSVNNYLLTVLNRYNAIGVPYTFKAVYDLNTQEMLMMYVYVDTIEGLKYEDYDCILNSMNVIITVVDTNDEDSVEIPEYVYTQIKNDITEPEVPVEDVTTEVPVEDITVEVETSDEVVE